jgi:integrase
MSTVPAHRRHEGAVEVRARGLRCEAVPRQATGSVVERKRQGGIIFALRFRAYGERHYVTLGSAAEGWTRRTAETELHNILADVRRGIWKPPQPEPVTASPRDPSFHEFASEWFEGLRHEGLSPNTLADYEWQLTHHLLPFFAEHRLSQITIAEVDRYRQLKVAEGALSATSINKTITRLAQILEVAVERELLVRNPARGKRRKLRQRKPRRTTLDRAEQIEAVLAAASELDGEARLDRRAIPRATLLATLAFGGVRIGEALALRWCDVDLAAGRLNVRDSKTDAGIREVDLLPVLRDELASHKATTRHGGPDDFVFPTQRGHHQNPSNVRNRVLARSIERANERLGARGLAPLPEGLTPHSLRRTFISLLLAIGEDVPYVMSQVGHSDPKVTLAIYAQVMFRGKGERERLRALVEGSDWAPMGTSADFEASHGTTDAAEESENPADSGASSDGRGWFRTSDLSRVKRALSH